jgi:hypothetical protein
VNDIESTVRTRLHHLTDDLPYSDPMLRVQAAKSLYRTQRRTRLGMVAVAAAVIATVGAPTALGSLMAASAPRGGQAAAPASSPSQSAEAAAAQTAARLAALDAAQQAAVARDANSRARGQAELAAAAERDHEYGSAMHECLSGLGIDSRVLGDGAVTYSVPSGQDAAYDAAIADCQSRTGYGPETRLSDDAYRVLYTDYLDVSRCLVTNGFSPSDPSTEEEFVISGGLVWDPYAGLSASAQATCSIPTY